jgi:hypothetical protein
MNSGLSSEESERLRGLLRNLHGLAAALAVTAADALEALGERAPNLVQRGAAADLAPLAAAPAAEPPTAAAPAPTAWPPEPDPADRSLAAATGRQLRAAALARWGQL